MGGKKKVDAQRMPARDLAALLQKIVENTCTVCLGAIHPEPGQEDIACQCREKPGE